MEQQQKKQITHLQRNIVIQSSIFLGFKMPFFPSKSTVASLQEPQRLMPGKGLTKEDARGEVGQAEVEARKM